MRPISPTIFRAYDIRGIVDQDFDPEWVEVFGRACGTFFGGKGYTRVVVGHDCRHSSPEYQQKLSAGIAATGLDVLCLGMVPTPVFYYAARTLDFGAGVMITASHNPPDFNGFKVWLGETTAWGEEIRALHDVMASGHFLTGSGEITRTDIVPAYIEDLSSRFRLARSLTVVVDGGNGTGGLITAELLRRVGCRVIELYCEPDGRFPNHHPDPVVEENTAALRQAVLEHHADFGVGLDGDNDRIGVVDDRGRLMYGDQLLAIYAREVLSALPGATVIGEVKCSHLLYRDIAQHGGAPLMFKTGHSLIKAKMKETAAPLAGEMSGHMFFADRYFGFDDASYAALRIAEIVARSSTPLSSLLADWPQTHSTPEIRMDCPDAIKFAVVEKAVAYFRNLYDIIDVDGVRITFPDGWALLRASNTQPVLVLRFEAESAERLNEIRSIVETPLAGWITAMAKGGMK